MYEASTESVRALSAVTPVEWVTVVLAPLVAESEALLPSSPVLLHVKVGVAVVVDVALKSSVLA